MKRRSKKVSRKPKKCRSPYIYFVKEYQNHLKRKHGKFSFVESSKLCAAKWRQMPDEKKKKYRDLSKKDLVRYRKQMKSYCPTPSSGRRKRRRKKKRDPRAPVRPLSAYLWFCKSMWKKVSEKNPDLSATEVMKRLARIWSECTEEMRYKYRELSDCDRKCYQMEKKKYRMTSEL